KSEPRQKEEGTVKMITTQRRQENPVFFVVTPGLNNVTNATAGFVPFIQGGIKMQFFSQSDAAIYRPPTQGHREHKTLGFAANFPDAIVGLVPALHRQVDNMSEKLP